MRIAYRIVALAALAAAPGLAQDPPSPPFASMTTSRVLLLPAQELAGAGDTRVWLARFDSVLTVRLVDGGIGSAWAYPRDAARFARMNPTYVSDPHAMGVQPLKNDKVKKGFSLPEPFASRLRGLLAVGDARDAIVPIIARIDTTQAPRSVKLQLMLVDGRASTVTWTTTIDAHYDGGPAVAADSLAAAVARLFVRN